MAKVLAAAITAITLAISGSLAWDSQDNPSDEVPLLWTGARSYAVQGMINNVVPIKFTIDTGADVVQIPYETVMEMTRKHLIGRLAFKGSTTTNNADGVDGKKQVIDLYSISVGNHYAFNVQAVVGPPGSDALLGQTFLQQFGSYTIDNRRGVISITA